MDFSKLTNRELDAEVVKRMGCKVVMALGNGEEGARVPCCGCGDTKHGGWWGTIIHGYSSTWEDAGQVLEHVQGSPFSIRYRFKEVLTKMIPQPERGVGWRYDPFDWWIDKLSPHAICEAFCMAVPLEDK